MQHLPDIHHRKSIFDSMLQQYDSYQPLPVQNSFEVQLLPQNIQEQMQHLKLGDPDSVWGAINSPLQTDLETDPQKLPENDLEVEIKRVTSSREQQQTRIVDYFTSCKELIGCSLNKKKITQEKGYVSKSLSPKKRKLIDKHRTLKVLPLEEN